MAVEKVTKAAINRGGCVGLPTDRWSTTTNYYPRFMEYLVRVFTDLVRLLLKTIIYGQIGLMIRY